MSRVRRWGGKPQSWARRATIGSAVHNATAILDCNGQTWDTAPREWIEPYDSVDREVAGFVRSWEECKASNKIILTGAPGIPMGGLVEHTLFAKSGITPFATTLDRVGLVDANLPAIIELKTPKAVEPYWGPQLAGQEEAMLQTFGPPVRPPYKYLRLVAQLFATGKPGKLIEHADKRDREVFLWSLGLATWNVEVYGWAACIQ